MDAFELLKTDHKKVAELFDLLETATGKRKLDVFKRIKSELEIHTHIEETILYPALKKPEETHDLTLEAYEEHKVIKTLLAELAAAKSANDQWQAKAKVLRENVEHHVEEEEKELFDKANDVLSDEELEALGTRMAAEKARKEGKPLPKSAANNASKQSAAKPGIIAKIAGLIGFGGGAAKKPAKKAPVKKKVAAKRSSKISKPASASASKRAAAAIESKRTPPARTLKSTKRSAANSGKKASKQRLGRK